MSDAVQLDRVSKLVGYKITRGNFQEDSPNLPHRIAILAEANTANQAQVTVDAGGREMTTTQKAGELYGYGSPIYQIMRILRPLGGGSVGVGGIPIFVYPQAEPVGASEKVISVTPSGTATSSGTHFLTINGRTALDGVNYNINIQSGDTAATIASRIEDIVNAILGSPVVASEDTGVVTLTSKWKGLTADGISVEIDTGDVSLGITYAIASVTSGSGTPSVTTSLNSFNENWNTIVVNSYGTVTAVMSELESYNGRPNDINPTGRYNGEIFKPFVAITGSVEDDEATITGITDARKLDLTIAIAPAPNSKGLALEAAANMTVLYATISQNNPQLDVQSMFYPDMPTPEIIGDMSDQNARDRIVKKGCSTVELSVGQYKVVDFVTTYHPDGETPPQYRYPRNLNIDWNIRFGYLLLEAVNVLDHVIANDGDIVTANKVIKPKQWIQVLQNYSVSLGRRALIADVPFMQDSLTVDISSLNPDRLETFFKYKRTGFARISSTTAEAGFNFGS